jgi:hypothetical protein
MPYVVCVIGNFQGTCDQADEHPGTLVRCLVDIFSNITYREIQWQGMMIARKLCQMDLVGSTNDGHSCHSGRNSILCISPLMAQVHLTVDSTTLRVWEAQRFEIEVCLKRKICYEQLDTFENNPVV